MDKLDNLRFYRKERKLTQSELAILSGVSVAQIRNLEEGKTNVDNVKLSTIKKLAKTLKVDFVKLLK